MKIALCDLIVMAVTIDNACSHAALDNMGNLRRNDIDVLHWWALSPDLSPIEHRDRLNDW